MYVGAVRYFAIDYLLKMACQTKTKSLNINASNDLPEKKKGRKKSMKLRNFVGR